MIGMLAVDDEEREVSQWKPSDRATHAGKPDDSANLRIVRDQLRNGLNVRPKPVAEAHTLAFIPTDLVKDLLLSKLVRTNRLCHLPKISRSTRSRNSLQPDVPASPASTAAQRRSISSNHA